MAAGSSNGRCVVPPDQSDVAKWVRDQDRETEQVCQKFSAIDAFFVITSLITYVFDLVTDCLLAWQYFYGGHEMCGMWTLVFVVIPTLTLQILSLRWYHTEGKQLCCSWTLGAHLTLLGPVERYISVLRHGLSARRSDSPQSYQRLYQAQNDVSTLRLIEAFLESAPQLILQGYFTLTTQPIHWLSGLSMAVSLVSLAWAVAVYSNTLRLAYRASHMTNWCSLVIQALWHTCIVASRVTAIVVFATAFHGWTFLPVGLHWLLMTLWVMFQGPDFFTRRWENKFFSLVLGVIFIFCFLNLKDGRTRHNMWPFYILLLAENGLFVGLWYRERPQLDTLMILVTAIVFGGYLTGVILMLLYYRCCHPSGPLYLGGENKAEIQEQPSNQVEPPPRRIFDASLEPRSPVFSSEGYNLSLDSSWSGLVDSRRPDTCNPTFTASRYNTSSRELVFEQNNAVRNPNVLCTELFDTPLCGGTVNPHIVNEKSESGHGIRSSWTDSQPFCNTIPLAQSECSAISQSNVSGSRLGCVSIDYSSRSRSKASQIGYDNAGFSIGSDISKSTKNIPSRFIMGHSAPSAAMSLPSVYPLSSTCISGESPQNISQGRQSSVFAITGTPSSCCYSSSLNLKQETSPVRHRINQNSKLELRSSRYYDHTQSLQSIPQERPVFNSGTLPLKSKMSKGKIGASRESLSSVSSSHKPRPLSPLNAQTLWEESMIRFTKSFEDDSDCSNLEKSNQAAKCSKILINDISQTSPSIILPITQNSCDLINSTEKETGSISPPYYCSKAVPIQTTPPASDRTDSLSYETSQNTFSSHGTSTSPSPHISLQYSLHNSDGSLMTSSRDTQDTSSLAKHSTSYSPGIMSSNNSMKSSPFSNYSSSRPPSHNRSHTKSNSQNSSTILSSQSSPSMDSRVFSSLQNSLSQDIASSLNKNCSPSISSHSHNNSSSMCSKSSTSFQSSALKNSQSQSSSPEKDSKSRSSSIRHSSSTGDSSRLSSVSDTSQSKGFGCFSAEGYRTDSSGFHSSAVDDSMDFFDYSDDYRNQSKHTLSDLAQRLNLVLDLNDTPGGDMLPDDLPVDKFFPIKDTPWRTDYLSRIPTPILRQSLLSLYAASDQSLYDASGLQINGSIHANSEYYFSTTCAARKAGYAATSKTGDRTPLKIYDLTKSPGSKSRFKQGQKQLSPQPTDSKCLPQVQLENYGNSPYRRIKNSRKSADNGGQNQKYPEENRRSISESDYHTRVKSFSKSRSMSKNLQHPSCEESLSDCRTAGFSSSSSEVWADISYSDTAENIDPNILATSTDKHTPESRQNLASTPDFSPIQRFELPPLTVGTGPLRSRQSYFSTPKATLPGYYSPSITEDNNITNDSFFGVPVPQMARSYGRSSSRNDEITSPNKWPNTNHCREVIPINYTHDINTNAAYKHSTAPRNNNQRRRPVRL